MRALIFILLVPILFSCGGSQFAKRKYTKGVYVEKRGQVKTQKSKVKKENYVFSAKKGDNGVKTGEKSVKNYKKERNNEIALSDDSDGKKEKANLIALNKDDVLADQEFEIDEEISDYQPPIEQDGEELTKSRKSDTLGKISGILGYTGLGIFILALLLVFIFWMVAYFGAFSFQFGLVIFYFFLYGGMALGLAALITGAISYSKRRNRMALAGIIIGSILTFFLLLSLIGLLL